jgi:hypothetical protein
LGAITAALASSSVIERMAVRGMPTGCLLRTALGQLLKKWSPRAPQL